MNLTKLAEEVGLVLTKRQLMLAVAESCTGGQISQVITSIAGSSKWFERGFITYSNLAKQELLGVRSETLTKYGAVSKATAQEMAEGALQKSHAQVSIAVTGIAGPTGGSEDKPVGTVWIAWAKLHSPTQVLDQHLAGDRDAIRTQAVSIALQKLIEYVSNWPDKK